MELQTNELDRRRLSRACSKKRENLHGTNVIKMPEEREHAAPKLVVPHFDLLIVSTGVEECLGSMEVHTANGTYTQIGQNLEHPTSRPGR